MTTNDLWELISTAQHLHTKTRSSLLPSAIAVLTNAYTQALADDEDPVLTHMEQVAATTVERMRDAELTLYAFSCIEQGKAIKGEQSERPYNE